MTCHGTMFFIKTNFVSDEIDALMGQRRDDDSGGKRAIASQLLVDLQGSRGICLVGATNTPWTIDSAFVRRFDETFYIPLPDRAARMTVIQKSLEDLPNTLLRVDMEKLASVTEGYSAADLVRMIKKASNRKNKKLMHAEYCAQSNQGEWFVCTKNFPGARPLKNLLVKEELIPPRISPMDFEFAMVNLSVRTDEIDKFKKFQEEVTRK